MMTWWGPGPEFNGFEFGWWCGYFVGMAIAAGAALFVVLMR